MCIKTAAVRMRRRYDNGKSEEIALKKRQRFDKHDDEEEQCLDRNESEVERDKYVLLPFFALLLPF